MSKQKDIFNNRYNKIKVNKTTNNIKDELIKNTEFINKAHLKLYELYLKNLERKEIYMDLLYIKIYVQNKIFLYVIRYEC